MVTRLKLTPEHHRTGRDQLSDKDARQNKGLEHSSVPRRSAKALARLLLPCALLLGLAGCYYPPYGYYGYGYPYYPNDYYDNPYFYGYPYPFLDAGVGFFGFFGPRFGPLYGRSGGGFYSSGFGRFGYGGFGPGRFGSGRFGSGGFGYGGGGFHGGGFRR